jgi:hypothetical protein
MQADRDKIAQVIAALDAKGIARGDYPEIRQLLIDLRQAQQNIQGEQGQQFFPEASKAVSGMGLTNANTAQIARSFRLFAEYVVGQALVLKDTYTSVGDIVDHIPSMP